ncbi:MAG: pectinesterase family protein [Chthoniobacterales bacterium]
MLFLLLGVPITAGATDYFVNPAGANGAFTTLQAAVDAVTGQTELNRANIFISPGLYHEQVYISKPYVSFIGTGESPGAVKITAAATPLSAPDGGWGETFGVRPEGIAFMARNLTLENSTPERDHIQALAAHSSADRAVFVDVQFLGFWDTLLVDGASRAYLLGCSITGSADFIFGDATAVFDRCTIRSTDGGWISAPNTSASTANGLIFLDCALVSASNADQAGGDGSSAGDRSVDLSRPWDWWDPGKMPSAIFIRTRMGPQISLTGWDPWLDAAEPGVDIPQDPDAVSRFAEFGSMDMTGNPLPDRDEDGTPDGRVAWADPMTAEQAANYTLEQIFGPVEFWNATTQPEAGDLPYLSQGAPWDVNGQRALLPSEAGPPSHALNMSTRLFVGTGENVMIAGFILRGSQPKRVVVRGLGGSLRGAGISDALVDPELSLRGMDGMVLRFNNNWKYAQEAEIASTGLAPADDHEAALSTSLAPGAYTAVLKGRRETSGVGLAEIYDLDSGAPAELVNVSTRGFVGSGENVMIAGFILGAGGPTKVLLRGIGPSLAQSGVATPLSDPTLTLRDADGALIAFNDDWQDSQADEIVATTIAPGAGREAAIVATLPPGSYTAVLAGSEDQTGVGLVEIYTLD